MTRVSMDTLSIGGLLKRDPPVGTCLVHWGKGMTLGRVVSTPRLTVGKDDDAMGTSEEMTRIYADILPIGGLPKHDPSVGTRPVHQVEDRTLRSVSAPGSEVDLGNVMGISEGRGV